MAVNLSPVPLSLAHFGGSYLQIPDYFFSISWISLEESQE